MNVVIEGSRDRSFGAAVRAAREAAGVSRAFVAELLAVSEAAVATWEQHTIPEPGSFEKLVQCFPELEAFDRDELVAKRSFSAHLRMLRDERGLSRAALGQEVGVSEFTVRAWENDSRPRAEALARLLRVLPELEQSSFSRRRSTRRTASAQHIERGVGLPQHPRTGALLHLHALVRADVAAHAMWLLSAVAAGRCSAKTLVEMLTLALDTKESQRCDD